MTGDQAAYDLVAKNTEVVCTGSISGALLAGLVGGSTATPAAGAAALFNQLAADLLAGSAFNLTNAASVQGLLSRAEAALAAEVSDGAPPATDKAAAVQAATETVVLLNSLLQQAVTTAQEGQMAEAARMVQVLARLASVCQASVAPAAAQLAAGLLTADAWRQQFGL